MMDTRHLTAGLLPAMTLLLQLFLAAPAAGAGWWIDLEGGRVSAAANDVAIPRDDGTRFSLTDELRSDADAYGRLRLGLDLNARSRLSLLVAPLTLAAAGLLDRPLVFEGVTFPAATPLVARYRFNSYRLTWERDVVTGPRWRLSAGVTAKIRDAEISVEGGGRSSNKTNVGFVPLLHGRLSGPITGPVGLLLEFDALAGPQGRAEDVFAGLTWSPAPRLAARAGYRLLEGGADVDAVYNFAWIDYWGAGLSYRFDGK